MEVIFVHGALVRDGQWWWSRTADLLRERTGVTSRSIALPSCGEATLDVASNGLAADAAALRTTLDAVEAAAESAIVVGHSYGGTVISEAGPHPAIAHVLYVSSYLPEIGESQASIMSAEPEPVMIADDGDGTLRLDGYDPTSFGARFLQDADETTQRRAWERVTSQSATSFVTPTSAAGWQRVNSTYLVCVDDRSTSIDLQRMHAARATQSFDLPTGHHPFVSHPDLVVSQLESILAASS